ncbi:hypothetical protein Ciccas_008487 [Cichlidogyrus casuarinus]|uniref:Uncharacterized protein n=1 Tax=Cichlidogyrus casuarinus TaxID=1844966 RepID=A0ABD2Q0L6_9PLAT
MGFLSGTIAWCYQPRGQYYVDAQSQYKAMTLSTSYQTILLFFEVLACDKLENNRNRWIFVCIPLMILCIFGVAVCIWSMKNNLHFEIELILSANALLFIFIALKLDKFITWSWAVVLIPLWILTVIFIAFELYGLALTFILCRSPDLLPEQRRTTMTITCGYAFVIFPVLIFEILFTKKMEREIDLHGHKITPLMLEQQREKFYSYYAKKENPLEQFKCQIILADGQPVEGKHRLLLNTQFARGDLDGDSVSDEGLVVSFQSPSDATRPLVDHNSDPLYGDNAIIFYHPE